MKFIPKELIVEHIVLDGFLSGYVNWIFHGETSSSSMSVDRLDIGDELQSLVHDAFGVPPTSDCINMDTRGDSFGGSNQHNVEFDKNTEKFFNLLKQAEHELYPESKYSLLS
ncbi:hypothetical protein A4A49_57517 [Nicotiana attenuata]|uniref:Transposase-associated domain-containing protein n=1 Tax=Nicotiana attenuata TaxID=49451 RepID=A0A1J6IEX7_NICAT|nr:hypothetical protein A4A49_57517 [Nicotiana attenuata]